MADPTAPTLLDQMFQDAGLSAARPSTAAIPPPSTTTATKHNNDDDYFGKGLRRGFLYRGPSTSTSKAKATEQHQMPTITRRGPSQASSSLVLPEVRAAMDREAEAAEAQRARALPPALQALLGRGDWVTPGLQQRIVATPGLQEALLSPRVIQALNKLGRDPQAALRKHQGDPAMGAVLAALSGLLGDHFEALGKEQPEEQEQEQEPRGKIEDVTDRDPAALARERAEQAAADEVLKDPEVCALLVDPDVRSVLEACRALQLQGCPTTKAAAAADDDGGRAREALARRMREPEMAGKLRRLAAAGVIRFD